MEQKSNGALIGSIVIIVLLVIGGIYMYKTSVKEKIEIRNQNTRAKVNTQTSNNDTNIENDLNNTNLDTLDSNL